MSNSRVNIKVGQEVFCKIDGKKVLLLTVTEDLRDQTLKVDELIREKSWKLLRVKSSFDRSSES